MPTQQMEMKRPWPLKVLGGLLLLALIVFVSLEARNAYEQYNYIGKAEQTPNTFTVQGEGKISAAPDLVDVSLGVSTVNASVKLAQTQNTQQVNGIVAALTQLGVDAKDMQTSNYSIYPNIDYANNKQTITGYTVSQDLEVKIRNLDSVGDVLAKAGELGANQVSGIDFTIDDPTALQAQARDKAIADAKTKAQALASELGLTILKVTSFSEDNNTPVPPRPMMMDAMSAGATAAAPSPSIQSGSLDVISDVSVTYEVR